MFGTVNSELMENPPDFYRIMSLRLSRALSDIGVNRWMVRRRRGTFLMIEASSTIENKLHGLDGTSFIFGSQSEGTTTPGLNSDIDQLICLNDTNIMSSWSEWEAGKKNMLMVKEDTCSPQHYLLQEIRRDSPEPVINSSDVLHVVDILAYIQADDLGNRMFSTNIRTVRYSEGQVLSVFASTAASCCIRNGSVVPRNILCLFESSLDTDVASSRLKLASFLVCHNELERAADVLNDVERRYDDNVQAVCTCGNMNPFNTEHYKPLCTTSVVNNDDVLLTNKTALCVRYSRQEAFCAPPILHYEMVRGLGEDINHRKVNERDWMNWAVVDSLPYLYYLQYLTFRDLGQRGRQRQAVLNLFNCYRDASCRSHLYHRETYFNLVGHCREMEGLPELALLQYRRSVEGMPRNNAAHWHIYRLNHGYEI
ncbi:hypothetical protein MAR_037338 [Mya arenaria]|uniref:Uncharacterized protein n=1 Tax=Mya arenaria TaxID=6604 RepID=A0ABY7FQT3_MYAAR|nr:hypothetical protein MAR_037338 [Mya arenaria]